VQSPTHSGSIRTNVAAPSTKTTMSDFHHAMMQRCIELALNAAGHTAPNPLVGCVITQGEQVVGEGFHPKAGEPHAEVFALRAAGDRAIGGTLYVNLEPCNHTGRTPPCSEAIIQAQLKRVVVGMVDPDPRVWGQGIERLRAAGIEVLVGVEEAACQRLNEAFVHRVRVQRPFGILKYAMTLDGKIATTTGHSAWVSNAEARTHVHQLRAHCDAVIVGTRTVQVDNPKLTSQRELTTPPILRNPLRVIMSRSMALPKAAHLWDTTQAPTLVLTQGNPNPELAAHLQAQGVEVISLAQLTPATAFQTLYDRGMMSVLWECGGTLAAQAIAHGMVQKVMAFLAPKLIGGKDAPSPIGDLGLMTMDEALALENVSCQMIGSNFLIEGYLGH
jgi:diaminohydroxyphosphoribosylaminopyrimidine deaminase / 5-amino-6-(5-phosphoribosylamino)uracil reductase